MANNSHFTGMQQFRPMVPPQQAPPYVSGPSQQFQPLVHTNVAMPPPSQMQFPQPMQQLAGRPVGGHFVPQGPSISHDFQLNGPVTPVQAPLQQNLPMSNNHVSGSGSSTLSLSISYTINADSSSSQYQMQTHDHNFPSGGQPWMSTSNQNLNSVRLVPLTGEQTAALSIPEANSKVDSTENTPSDWIEHTSRNGKKYYYNRRTGISSWEKPLELMTVTERADASTDWREFTSPEGKKYYYNKVTRQSKWKIPDEVKLARERMKVELVKGMGEEENTIPHAPDLGPTSGAKVLSPSPDDLLLAQGDASSPISVAPVANLPTAVASESSSLSGKVSTPTMYAVEMQVASEHASPAVATSEKNGTPVTLVNSVTPPMTSSEATPFQEVVVDGDGVSPENTEEVKKGAAISEKGSVTPSEEIVVEPGTVVYESKLEAKSAFKALLESANVGSEWTWDQAMRAIINDRRYGALKSLGERKQAFNEYVGQKKKLEADERRGKQKKAREDFKTMLEECKELSPSTRWSKVMSIFENDERFKAVERAKDREDLFESYMEELEKKEHARALEEHKRNQLEYLEFLKSCDFIKASSQWRKVQDRLEADERCSRLEKIDRLEIFQEYTHDLEREEEEQRKLRMDESRKAERKNRDEFRKLMEEHVASGILNAKTHWRDYCIKVKDLPAYLAVSSNTSGSKAKDLFDDVVDELEKQYLDDKARIRDAVRMGEIGLTSSWTLEDFKAAIAKDISSPPLSDTNLKFVFEELLERAREREEKEAKRRKRLADDFYELLHTSKEITASSKWEDCISFFGDRIVGEESLLLEIFDKFVSELKEKAKEKERKRQEDKARKEKERKERERKDRERKKEKHRSDKDRGDDSRQRKERTKKDGTDSDKAESYRGDDSRKRKERTKNDGSDSDKAESYSFEDIKRLGNDRDKKHHKRHMSSLDDDENEKDRSRSSYRHSTDRKKSKQMDHHTWSSEAKSEGQHKKHKRDHWNGSHRNGDYEDYRDGEFGEDVDV